MSDTVNLQRLVAQLKKAQADLPAALAKAATASTRRAIKAAADATPPKAGTGRLAGTNMLTGELKAHWATDSQTKPTINGNLYETMLANNKEYASYVNDGHRMDKHFVPGLYIDENGQLNRDLTHKVGLMVGTKTKYVKGEFMTDKGTEAYSSALKTALHKEIRGLLK